MLSEFLLRVRATGTEEFAKSAKETERAVTKTELAATKLAGHLSKISMLAAGTAILKWAHQSVKAAQDVTDLADRTGIARDKLQAMQYAAEATGTSFNTLISAFESLGKAQGSIVAGLGRAEGFAEAFEALGISVEEVKSKSPEKLFAQLLSRMKEGTISASDLAAGVKVLGGAFPEMLAPAKDGLAELVAAFKDSHMEINDSTAEQLDVMGVAWDKFWTDRKFELKKFVAETIRGFASMGLLAQASVADILAKFGVDGAAEFRDEALEKRALLNENATTNPEGERLQGELKRKQANRKRGELDATSGVINMTPEKVSASAGSGGSAPSGDELSRIGLFRGESGGISGIMRSQVQELKRVNSNLRTLTQKVSDE